MRQNNKKNCKVKIQTIKKKQKGEQNKMVELTKKKKEKLRKMLDEFFPNLENLQITIKEDKIYLCSPLSVAEAKLEIKHIEAVEKLLNAKFEGIISNNGLYGSIYKLN